MNTRTANASPRAQERYMSSLEYVEAEGVKGLPVAARAARCADAGARSLLYFLQALSARPGGLRKVATELIAMFPECIGSPTMHKLGTKPGRHYTADEVRTIRDELGLRWSQFPLRGEYNREGGAPLTREEENAIRADVAATSIPIIESEWMRDRILAASKKASLAKAERHARQHPISYPASVLIEHCRERAAAHLAGFLVEYCINPHLEIVLPGRKPALKVSMLDEDKIPSAWNCETASLCYFHDVTGALLEYKRHYEEQARGAFAETAVSREVFRTLERGRRSRKIVIAEGIEGVGKSFSAEAWCEQHLGEARFVRLEGIVNRTTFFATVSSALGLADGVSQKSQEMQIRIRHHLERSVLMLVVDEAHRLFGAAERIYSHPELLNWIYSLWDLKIPVALIVTPQFVSRMDAHERQTDWRSGQLKRRVEVWRKLPEKLSEADLRAVAQNVAPAYSVAMIDELVDFGLVARRQLDAIRRAISSAEFIAEEHGRSKVTLVDLQAGIRDAQLTEQAVTTPLDVERQIGAGKVRGKGGRRIASAVPLQDGCTSPVTACAEEPISRAGSLISVTHSRGNRPALV